MLIFTFLVLYLIHKNIYCTKVSITFYDDYYYHGNAFTFSVNAINSEDDFHCDSCYMPTNVDNIKLDSPSSIDVPEGYYIRFYERIDCIGGFLSFCRSDCICESSHIDLKGSNTVCYLEKAVKNYCPGNSDCEGFFNCLTQRNCYGSGYIKAFSVHKIPSDANKPLSNTYPVGFFGVFIDLGICLPWNIGSIQPSDAIPAPEKCLIDTNDNICSLSDANKNTRRKRGPGNRNEHQLNEAQVFIMFMGFIIENVIRQFIKPTYIDYTMKILNQEKTLQDVLRVNDGICENRDQQSSRVINFNFMYDSDTGRVLNQFVENFLNLTPAQQYAELINLMINAFKNNLPITDLNKIQEFRRKINAVIINRQRDISRYKDKLDKIIKQSNSCAEKIKTMSKSQDSHNRVLKLWEELNRILIHFIEEHNNLDHVELKL